MNKKKKKQLFLLIVFIAMAILVVVGATFAYFIASVNSAVNAVSMTAAEFKVEMKDDVSLMKTSLIPSAEKYVDRATILRLDENGDFKRPYEEDGIKIRKDTACIDDNNQEICSIYTFTIINPMTTTEFPANVTLNPAVNSFSNLYFKVVNEEKKVVQEATHIKDDREFTYDADGKKVFQDTSKISPIPIPGINVTLPKATIDETTGKVIPSEATFSIILWIMETGENQTREDASQVFAGTVVIQSSGINGGGITGTLTAGGEE